jgi:hypothetical protein
VFLGWCAFERFTFICVHPWFQFLAVTGAMVALPFGAQYWCRAVRRRGRIGAEAVLSRVRG